MVPLALTVQICAGPPSQSQSHTGVIDAVPAPFTARQWLPCTRMVPSPGSVHCCLDSPSQVHNWTWLPLEVAPPALSRHLPPMPVIGPDTLAATADVRAPGPTTSAATISATTPPVTASGPLGRR